MLESGVASGLGPSPCAPHHAMLERDLRVHALGDAGGRCQYSSACRATPCSTDSPGGGTAPLEYGTLAAARL